MISRRTLVLDRAVTLVLSVALLAGGGLAVWWWSGTSGLAEQVDLGPAESTLAAVWWPAVAALVGLVLVLVGLRWLLAHLGGGQVPTLHLRGSGEGGRLEVDPSRVAAAAAAAFADTAGVRSARGRIVRDRGQLVARISATIELDADLAGLAHRADEVSADLDRALGRQDLYCSVELRVGGPAGLSLRR